MFHKISAILPKILAKNKIAPHIGATLLLLEVESYIKDIFGKKLSTNAKPLYVKDGIITIATSSSHLMSELKLYESAILERLREKFPRTAIQGLRFMVS